MGKLGQPGGLSDGLGKQIGEVGGMSPGSGALVENHGNDRSQLGELGCVSEVGVPDAAQILEQVKGHPGVRGGLVG